MTSTYDSARASDLPVCPTVSRSLAFLSGLLLTPTLLLGQVTEEEFKRALQQNLDQPVDPNKLVGFLLVIVAVVLASIVVSRWRRAGDRPTTTAAVNSPSKLIREIGKTANLRPAELKQLRILCEQQNIDSPLVMLLCPSMLGKAIRENQRKIDRNVLAGLGRKIARR